MGILALARGRRVWWELGWVPWVGLVVVLEVVCEVVIFIVCGGV